MSCQKRQHSDDGDLEKTPIKKQIVSQPSQEVSSTDSEGTSHSLAVADYLPSEESCGSKHESSPSASGIVLRNSRHVKEEAVQIIEENDPMNDHSDLVSDSSDSVGIEVAREARPYDSLELGIAREAQIAIDLEAEFGNLLEDNFPREISSSSSSSRNSSRSTIYPTTSSSGNRTTSLSFSSPTSMPSNDLSSNSEPEHFAALVALLEAQKEPEDVGLFNYDNLVASDDDLYEMRDKKGPTVPESSPEEGVHAMDDAHFMAQRMNQFCMMLEEALRSAINANFDEHNDVFDEENGAN